MPQQVGAPSSLTAVAPRQPINGVPMKETCLELLHVLLRPLRTATFLWCFLLIVTTHDWILWVSLVVVLLHIVRDILRLLKVALFSGPLLQKIGEYLRNSVETAIAGLEVVTRENIPKTELQTLLNKILLFEIVTSFLRNRDLAVKWAWFLAIVFLGGVYVYLALLFSFVYYGIARVSAIAYSWPDALVTSLFIPLLIGDLPRIVWAKLLGGLQCTLIVVVGFGTVLNFIVRKLDYIRVEAITLSERFADQTIRERYLILKERAGTHLTNNSTG